MFVIQRWLMAILFAVMAVACKAKDVTKEITVKATDVPFQQHLQMKAGDCRTFILPDGKTIAVWCQKRRGIAEQETRNGLKTAWGERPYVRPELKWKDQADGSHVAAGWASYIEQGPVISRVGDKRKEMQDDWSEYYLFEGKWQFTIIENLEHPHFKCSAAALDFSRLSPIPLATLEPGML